MDQIAVEPLDPRIGERAGLAARRPRRLVQHHELREDVERVWHLARDLDADLAELAARAPDLRPRLAAEEAEVALGALAHALQIDVMRRHLVIDVHAHAARLQVREHRAVDAGQHEFVPPFRSAAIRSASGMRSPTRPLCSTHTSS